MAMQPKEPQRANIGPVACYFEAKDFLGDRYSTFLAVTLVGFLVAGPVPLVLVGPIFCGMAICLLKRSAGARMEFEHLFKGFDYFVQSLIAVLLYMAIVLALFVPFIIFFISGVVMLNSHLELFKALGVLLLIVSYLGWFLVTMVASLLLFFACIAIVDRQIDGVVAIQLAGRGFIRNFWGVILTAIVGQLILLVGVMMCIIPAIFVAPIVVTGHYLVYQKIFGLSSCKPIIAEIV